jgi:prepilin-type N-terminal cleavage/methylation domain-containing protein
MRTRVKRTEQLKEEQASHFSLPFPNETPPRQVTEPPSGQRQAQAGKKAFTLAEVVVSIAIMAVLFNGIILAYIQASYRSEWSGLSLAAQALGIQQLEQARAAVWDMAVSKNELTNLNLTAWTYNTSTRVGTGYSWATLDLPITGTNTVSATNYVTVRQFYMNGITNPPVQLQMVTVDTVWPFQCRSQLKYFTNRTATYFAPDNRDASTL